MRQPLSFTVDFPKQRANHTATMFKTHHSHTLHTDSCIRNAATKPEYSVTLTAF